MGARKRVERGRERGDKTGCGPFNPPPPPTPPPAPLDNPPRTRDGPPAPRPPLWETNVQCYPTRCRTPGPGGRGEMQLETAKNVMQKKMQIKAFTPPPPCQNGACDTNLSMDCHKKRRLKARQMQKK